MAKIDYLRNKAKINSPQEDAIAETFFGKNEAPGLYAMVPVDKIEADPGNPRTSMDPVRLQQLADSIREKGIIHPLNLIELEGGGFRVEEGHRRHAAAQIAGLERVPAIVTAGGDLSSEEVLERQLVENLHNEVLPAVDSARAIRKLMDDHQLSIREVARKISLPKSTVDDYLAILRIPAELLDLPGVPALPKKALILVSREPREEMADRLRLALGSKTPWRTVAETRKAETRAIRFTQRFPLKSIPGAIRLSLERHPDQVTRAELVEAYGEANELLRKQRDELLGK